MSELEKAIEQVGEQINDLLAKALSVDTIKSKQDSSVDFTADDGKGIYGKGLFWKGDGNTKQFIYRANPNRIWTTETIDLDADSFYSIGNTAVLRRTELGTSVRKSYLTEVGTLDNLRTQGNLVIDDYIHYSSDAQRLGFGTESPNASLSIVSLDSEFIVDVEGANTRIGNWTTDDLEIVTDDTARIVISKSGNIVLGSNAETKTTVQGKLGVNVKNPDVDISTAGAVRFEGKKFEVAGEIPTQGTYRKGDVVWHNDPKPTGYVGWICVREGTPGEWRPFGQISN